MTSIIGILHNNAKITVLTNSISSVDSSLLCSYVAEGERESMCSPMSLLIRTLILLDQGSTLVTSFNFTLSQTQSHWRLRLRHLNLEERATQIFSSLDNLLASFASS